MVGGIEQYLTEFRLDGSVKVEPPIQPKPQKAAVEKPADDTVERIRQAEQRGRDEGRAAAQQEFELVLQAERARHEQHLAGERTRWAEQQGVQLAECIGSALCEMEMRLGESVARILAPFITEALRVQVMENLRAVFMSLVSDKRNAAIRVSGPQDMLSALSAQLGETGPAVEFVPNDAVDVSILVGDATIETQLEAWIGHLAQAMQSS